jgi:hypothetical protein
LTLIILFDRLSEFLEQTFALIILFARIDLDFQAEEKGWPKAKAFRRQRLSEDKGWPKAKAGQRERMAEAGAEWVTERGLRNYRMLELKATRGRVRANYKEKETHPGIIA